MVGDIWNSLFFLQNLPMRATYVFDDASNEACGYKNAFLRLLFCIKKVQNFEYLTLSKVLPKILQYAVWTLTLMRECMVQKGS